MHPNDKQIKGEPHHGRPEEPKERALRRARNKRKAARRALRKNK